MKKNLYRGYSSFEFQRIRQFKLTNIDLVKMDLLNHLFTQRGSRVMMPTFGTIIPELVFEPLDIETLDTLEEEVKNVLNYDPRVKLNQLHMRPDFDNNAVYFVARLTYLELNIVDDMEFHIEFEGTGN